MTEQEFERFLQLLGLPANAARLEPGQPFAFTLAQRYDLSLELNGTGHVMVLLRQDLPHYELSKLKTYLEAASYLKNEQLHFAVGYAQGKVIFALQAPLQVNAHELSDLIMQLVTKVQALTE